MPFELTLHYDNAPGFGSPHLWVWYTGSATQEDVPPSATDDDGFVYRVAVRRSTFLFKFKEGPGTAGPWEGGSLDREYRPLEHPGEEVEDGQGGLYFNGQTQWGNRVATEKADVQNMLIDACKLLVAEYHVDGFRLDATHTHYMDHRFLARLAEELKAVKSDVVLVAENLPNQPDLNRNGFDGYAQWSEIFHDKIKALLREGRFQGQSAGPENVADAFFFSKQRFASHTNNTVNYCETIPPPRTGRAGSGSSPRSSRSGSRCCTWARSSMPSGPGTSCPSTGLRPWTTTPSSSGALRSCTCAGGTRACGCAATTPRRPDSSGGSSARGWERPREGAGASSDGAPAPTPRPPTRRWSWSTSRTTTARRPRPGPPRHLGQIGGHRGGQRHPADGQQLRQ